MRDGNESGGSADALKTPHAAPRAGPEPPQGAARGLMADER
jgi:hypothetical protein